MTAASSSTPLERILAVLADVKQTKPDEWMATCPAHEDNKRSLSIGIGNNGSVLVKCFASCQTSAVLAALGLTEAALFPDVKAKAPRAARKTIRTLYDYTDKNGDLLYQVLRYEPKEFRQRRPDPAKAGGWIWSLQGVQRVLYRLPDLDRAIATGDPIYLVEGEKDADNLQRLGMAATTNAGGADGWLPVYSASLKGAHVVLVPDNDKPGRKHVVRAGADLIASAASVRVIELPNLQAKEDVSDWLRAGGSVDELRRLLVSAPGWREWSAAQSMTDEPDPQEGADGKQQEQRSRREQTINADGLPWVETNGRATREASKEIFAAILLANDPPSIFVRGDELVRVDVHEEAAIKPINADRLSYTVARVANCVSTSKDRGTVPVHPPDRLIRDILAYPRWQNIPPLQGIVTSPVVGTDGEILLTPGYLRNAAVYYHEPMKFELPDTTPTEAAVVAARSLLLDVLLVDFPFVDDASRANALGLLLLPFVRPYIRGSTPFHMIEAPIKGTGKSLLARVVMIIYLAREPTSMTAPGPWDKDEWRKLIGSQLDEGGPFFFLDNISGALRSAELELALTAPQYAGRRIGTGQMIKVPVRCVFIGTSNNAEMLGDLDRRTSLIRLDSKEERPETRTGFKIADIAGFATTERPRLMAACLTLIRAWIQAGKPAWSKSPVGSFEVWSRTIGGILETVGVSGFQENREEMYSRMDPEREQWDGFIKDWYAEFDSRAVIVGDIIGFAVTRGIVENTEQKAKQALGDKLRKKNDVVISGLKIHRREQSIRGSASYELLSRETKRLDFDNEGTLGTLRDFSNRDVDSPNSQNNSIKSAKGNTFGNLLRKSPEVPKVPQSEQSSDLGDGDELTDPFSDEDYGQSAEFEEGMIG